MTALDIADRDPPPHALLRLLRTAIDADSFVVAAEPIVELSSGEPSKHGLMLRLPSGDGQFIASSNVESIAERFGLTTQLDDLLIGHAVRLAARGPAVALHVHAASLADPDLARRTEQAVVDGQIDPALVTFELAEQALAASTAAASAFVVRMHELGCSVTADHFGLGSAGFGHLKRIPIGCLKIDASFITDLRSTPSDEQFVRAFVQLAEGLGIGSAADGVRDGATQDILADAGVGHGQGPHFGAPEAVGPGGLAALVALHRASGAP